MPRPGPAFPEFGGFDRWATNWCKQCLREAPIRNGISQWGCSLVSITLGGEIPDEWVATNRPEDPYNCTSYRPMGWRKPEAEAAPEPIPAGQLTLFEEEA